MQFYETYSSNSIAGTANQCFTTSAADSAQTGRMFYKIENGGEYEYALAFSNIVASTYAQGEISRANRVCDEWEILSMRVGRCDKNAFGSDVEENGTYAEKAYDFREITFGGKTQKTVMPGEFYSTDPFIMAFEKDEYLCLEVTFKGKMIPYHPEVQIPVYRKTENGWSFNKEMPPADMIGVKRAVKTRVAFLGDSITQGIGPDLNSYEHWNAFLSKMLGGEYAFWNLGIGYGRAADIATDGAWLFKAKQNDFVVLCAGVNDILHTKDLTPQQLIASLETTVSALKAAGCRVFLQTMPPFDYIEEQRIKWEAVNAYIKTEMIRQVEGVFDVVPVIGLKEAPHMAKYGGHPDSEGCLAWAKALYPAVKAALEH